MSLRYRNLIRKIMRTFYDIPESLVMEYIYYHDRIEQSELAKLLHLDANKVRSYVVKFKRDKFIIEDHRLESNQNNVGPRTKDLYYYRIDIPSFINVVNYRLIQMLHFVENLERQQTYKQTKYKCIRCEKEYTEFDIGKLFDISQDALVCSMCGDLVQEDNETKETTTEPAQAVTVSLYNEQMKPLFEILREIDELNRQEQHLSDSTTLNGNSTLASGNHHTNTGSIPVPATHRSHASTVFDRTATINHNIDIFIERDDDDDHYAPMDIDETSNTDSFIGSSRGPGKPGKKPSKPVQSTAEVATQPISAKMKAANKKVPYEPKPTPIWFLESTVHIEQEERRSNNSTTQTTTTTTTTTSMSRQLSNSKLTKTSRLNDIKQLLLAHERKNKTLSLTNNIEDSLSPPTPIQLTRTTDSQ